MLLTDWMDGIGWEDDVRLLARHRVGIVGFPDQLSSRGLGRSARPLPSAGLRETRKRS